VIPDEQDAIDAALHMGEPGDLVLIFADALVRSWKQITKFKPSGAPAAQPAAHPAKAPSFASSPSPANGNTGSTISTTNTRSSNGEAAAKLKGAAAAARRDVGTPAAPEVSADFNLEGLIRDERGIRMAPESDD
jgi:hypothetical protein